MAENGNESSMPLIDLLLLFTRYQGDQLNEVATHGGGWEVWAQVEFAVFVQDHNWKVLRERRIYNDALRRVDFIFGNDLVMELKCNTNTEKAVDFARRLRTDYEKLGDVKTSYQTATRFVVGLSPNCNDGQINDVNIALKATPYPKIDESPKDKTNHSFCQINGEEGIGIWWCTLC